MVPEFQELEKRPLAERVELVEALWDSIARSCDEVPIPQWQKAELRRRRQAYLKDPESAQAWSEVKTSILESQG